MPRRRLKPRWPEFSNDKTAQVPADKVVATEQLSPNLDWSTFQLGTIGFGRYVVNVPPGLTSYSTRVDATATPTATPTPTPPSLVTVESLQVETIKVAKGKKAKKGTVLALNFSGALNATSADNASAYPLAPIIKVKASGKGKNRRPATTKLGAAVSPASAAYSASNNQVTLVPRGKLTASKPEELIVTGALLTDALGREIDGDDDGQAGSDYVATVSGTRLTTGGLPLARTHRQTASVADVVDHLLDRGELTRDTVRASQSVSPWR